MSAVLISSVCDDDESSEQFEDRERRLGAPVQIKGERERNTNADAQARQPKNQNTKNQYSFFFVSSLFLSFSLVYPFESLSVAV